MSKVRGLIRSRWSRRFLALVVGMISALIVGEIGLRVVYPHDQFVGSRNRLEGFDEAEYQVDPEFGFRPRLGSPAYDEYGARRLRDDYPDEKLPGRRRLLFLGDSVTRRRAIELGFREVYGEAGLEYWNAGVGSFNTVQEEKYFRYYNHRLDPDHVILTFHNNDFNVTYAMFRGEEGLTLYEPKQSVVGLNPWLFDRSYLYRAWTAFKVGWKPEYDLDQARADVRAALQGLRDLIAEKGARFTVLLLPPLMPSGEWLHDFVLRHRSALEILSDLGIDHFDLMPALERALEAGVDVQESPDDWQHPSAEMGQVIARYLAEQGLRL